MSGAEENPTIGVIRMVDCWPFIRMILGVIVSWVLAILGGPHILLTVFFLFVAADWLLAMCELSIRGYRWRWTRTAQGGLKILAYLILIAVFHGIDIISRPSFGFDTGDMCRRAYLIFINGMELVSIFGHAWGCGCRLPSGLRTWCQNQIGKEDEK